MKDKINTILFITILFTFFLMSILIKDADISYFERRKLAQFPSKYNEDFSNNLDKYLSDQFAFREQFIMANFNIMRNILQIKDVNDVYVENNDIYEKIYPLKEKQCYEFCDKVNYIINQNLQNSNVYYSIIPDKSSFLDNEKHLKIDYNNLYNLLNQNIQAKYINIQNMLNIEDYYNTDIHWRQERIGKVADELVKQMGQDIKNIEYNEKIYPNFYGALYSKAGISIAPDNLVYLNSPIFENTTVKHLEYGEKSIYDEEKLNQIDSYDVFLSGPSSYIEIENKGVENRELIIFRDSFTSSLVPLIVPYYSKITLVDLRYIQWDIAKSYLKFEGNDILFLYSVSVINNSNLLKIQ